MSIGYVTCRGTESSLAECAYYSSGITFNNCLTYAGSVGVLCKTGSPRHTFRGVRIYLRASFPFQEDIERGNLHLSDGLTQYEGRVEIYWNSEWQSICNEGWDELDATVVCRQLNYLSTSVQIQGNNNYCADLDIDHNNAHDMKTTTENYIAFSLGQASFKGWRKSYQYLLADVGCSGTESNLVECCATEVSSSLYCHSGLYAGVRCMNK